MKIVLILAVLILITVLYINYKANHFMDDMTEEERTEWNRAMEEERQQQEREQEILKSLRVYRILRDSIHDDMSLEEMIDAFALMCKTSVGDPDNLLFETGTYHFTGEKLFYFSLVRQFQFRSEDEYVQLHLDLTYTPSVKTALLFTTKWDSQVDGDFFEMVKSSRAFAVVKNLPPVKVDIHIEET